MLNEEDNFDFVRNITLLWVQKVAMTLWGCLFGLSPSRKV